MTTPDSLHNMQIQCDAYGHTFAGIMAEADVHPALKTAGDDKLMQMFDKILRLVRSRSFVVAEQIKIALVITFVSSVEVATFLRCQLKEGSSLTDALRARHQRVVSRSLACFHGPGPTGGRKRNRHFNKLTDPHVWRC